MNVLIVGEFSAFAKNLALGINSIPGNECVVFSYKDGFKDIAQDSRSYTYQKPYNLKFLGITLRGTNKITGRKLYKQFQKDISNFKGYFDAVFIISYTLLREESNHSVPLFSKSDILKVVKDPNKVFMSSCGGDRAFYQFALNDRRFNTVYKDPNVIKPRYKLLESEALSIVKKVIPMSYQYHEAYKLYANQFELTKPIPLPFDSTTVQAKTQYCVNNKIVIFNGSLRPTKGSVFIDEAVKRIAEKYPDRVVIRKDRLPYQKFLSFLKEIDIYIDLCTDYDYGMSAIAAMLAGCVVLSGNEPETGKAFGWDDIPVIPACPDADQIFDAIEDLILHPDKIEEIGRKSVEYARLRHDCKSLAPIYMEAFK